ncbi:MAG: hypothetical protein LBC37_03840 [Zoogloeaceae bacterium]|nr:hypothetical protein [Zoogloeaceae bacterium]
MFFQTAFFHPFSLKSLAARFTGHHHAAVRPFLLSWIAYSVILFPPEHAISVE